jgi:hypothetical protein
MSGNVVMHDCTRHTRNPLLTMRPAERLAFMVILATLPKQLLGLMNARWISVHEVEVRLSLGKIVPLGRRPKIL